MKILETLSEEFGLWAKENAVVVTTAESCTAGLISATIAMTSGSSAWLDRAFVVYTPDAKHEMLGVKYSTIEEKNITSEDVAREMASGALSRSAANVSISVTGVAGPGGGTDAIPVGTVCMAYEIKKGTQSYKFSETVVFSGTRNEIREKVVAHTLGQLREHYKELDVFGS